MGIRTGVARFGVGVCLAVGLFGAGAASAQQTLNFQLLAGGYTGDGGQAINANLHGIGDIVRDGAGNMYVAQYWDNRIRKITPAGVITTVVGGNTGFAGDGGQASQALINHPGGLAFDSAGNLYFADAGNARVRRISTTGVITTVAGNGVFADAGSGIAATSASFLQPWGLAFDGNGNLFVSDRTANRIRKIAPNGTITYYAGTGAAGNTGNGGPATAATFFTPQGMDTDIAGNLYIADTQNSVVRRVATDGTITEYVNSYTVLYPTDVEVDGALNLWAGSSDCTLVRVPAAGAAVFYGDSSGICAKSPDGASAATAGFGVPDGIVVDAANDVYFADTDHARVARISGAGLSTLGTISTFAGATPNIADGSNPLSAALTLLSGISVSDNGDVVFADSLFARRIRKLSGGKLYTIAGNGNWTGGCSAPCSGMDTSLNVSSAVLHAPGGVIFISDRANNRVWRMTPDGNVTRYAGGGSSSVPNLGDGGYATSAVVDPFGMALDSAGNLFIADFKNHRIRKIAPDGIISTYAGTGAAGFGGDGGPASAAYLNSPYGLAIDGADNLYVADYGNHRVRKITPQGVISTLAGNGSPGTSGFGDGGPALSANVASPVAVAAQSGSVYVSTRGTIRRITPTGRIEAVNGFPNYAYGLTIKNGYLYATSDNGRVSRALLPRRALHDFDADGKSDLHWRSTWGTNTIWKSANSATQQAMATRANTDTLAAEGDFDGDGKADVLWRNATTGANAIWLSGNSATPRSVYSVAAAWSVAGTGDFNGDGQIDLLWRNTWGGNSIWLSGNGATQQAMSTLDVAWKVAGIGDFDGDGKSDVLWRNSVNGGNQIWLSGNAATKKPVINVGLAWKVAGIGDFNFDGVSDIVWRSTYGTNTIWKSGNGSTQQGVVGITGADWNVAAVGDYDNDGFSDLLWRSSNTGANVIWRAADMARQQAVSSVATGWSVVPVQPQP